jgi:uncharacterized protein
MTREQITKVLLEHANDLKVIGATSLYMFGSRARGDNQSDSDLDLFIDFDAERKVPLASRLLEFERDIKLKIGINVEIATRYDFHDYVKTRIEQEAVQVF